MPDESTRTREILRKVRQVEIRTRRLVTDAIAGAYHSSFKGQGMDFEEVREYTVGDDVRAIDWNVTARTGRPHIKLFREERELTLMLMVDLSASGLFGSGETPKRELAAEVASVLAFSAVRNADKVGLILFTDRIERYVPPKKGRQHVLRVIREILFHRPQGKGTDLGLALEHLNRILRRHSVCFLISDFLQGPDGRLPDPSSNSDDPLFKSLAVTSRRHDLSCLIVNDPRESELPAIGLVQLEDSETGETVLLNTNRSRVREAYRNINLERARQLSKGLSRRGIDHLALSTDRPYIRDLQHFFEKRAQRR